MKRDDKVVTEKVLKEVLDKAFKKWTVEVAEAILDGVDRILKDYASKKDIEDVKTDIGTIKRDLTDIKRDISDLKADTPTQKEFNDLKSRVDKYVPT